MPVSSFFGMQTSLRGLLAQQRMLDTTGHNIANASTQGYSRQEAMLSGVAPRCSSRSPARQRGRRPPRLRRRRDQGFRRVRDQFLDSQYRAQNTNVNEWNAKADALDTAELSLAEPGENGINAAALEVLERLVGPLQGPGLDRPPSRRWSRRRTA